MVGLTLVFVKGSHCSVTHSARVKRLGSTYVPDEISVTSLALTVSASFSYPYYAPGARQGQLNAIAEAVVEWTRQTGKSRLIQALP